MPAKKAKRSISRPKTKQQQAKDGGSSGGSGGGSGSGAGGTGGKSPEQAQKESKEELERQKLEARKRFQELGGTVSFGDDIVVRPVSGELDAAQDAVIAAQNESKQKSEQARLATDDETKKKLQEEAARANRKYELAKITFKRLEAECISVTNEAEGLGIERFELNFLVSRGF